MAHLLAEAEAEAKVEAAAEEGPKGLPPSTLEAAYGLLKLRHRTRQPQ